MLESLKENLGQVINFVEEKYGELTKDDVKNLQEKPNEFFDIVSKKFNVEKKEVEDYVYGKISELEGNETVKKMEQGVTNAAENAKDIFGGFNKR